MINAKRSIEACAAFHGDDSKAMKNYLLEGEKVPLAMINRGHISFYARLEYTRHHRVLKSKELRRKK